MARNEADREDLIREATALVDRLELIVPGFDAPVTAGFRRHGGLSLFFDQDPVYQFDSAGRMRRGFVAGKLFRSQGDTLAELTRQRTDAATTLLRRDLPADELAGFRNMMLQTLQRLADQLAAGTVVVQRAVAESESPLNRVAESLQQIMEHRQNWLSHKIGRR
jgi:hypothetical protein